MWCPGGGGLEGGWDLTVLGEPFLGFFLVLLFVFIVEAYRKKCASCRDALSCLWVKRLCQGFITGLVQEETWGGGVSSIKEELVSTFQAFRSVLVGFQSLPDGLDRCDCGMGGGAGLPPYVSDLKRRGPSGWPFRGQLLIFKLPLDVDKLLGAIYEASEIMEQQVELSRHNHVPDLTTPQK